MLSSKLMAGPWVTEHEIKVVEDCMRNGWDNYDYVEKFEKEFAEYHGRKYAIMTPNCTTAIHLLLTGMGITDDDEVLVPECTWVGSVAGITYQRAMQVFCDINPDDWCINPESIERNITERTKAIIAVDIYGNMPDWDTLEGLADRCGIAIIEDAAEAVGSTYKGRRAGNFGIASVFSFHRTKTIATGEGGMLLLDNDELFERCHFLRDHGRRPDGPAYFNFEVTYKYMPFNLQAAMGYAQFQRIDELVGKKNWIYRSYRQRLADIDDILVNPEPQHVYNGAWITGLLPGKSYGIDKLEMIRRLGELGVPARPFFYPLSSLPAFGSQADIYREKNPVAYDVCSRGINLPGALIVTEEQIDEVCDGVREVFKGLRG